MMKKVFFVFCLLFPELFFGQRTGRSITTDVLVIGGGVGGTAAAIQCARMGVKTVLVEETNMLGGMLTAAGVSCTDGNDQLASGMWEEFRLALYRHYGKNKLNTGWVSNTNFEPHVGDSIFKAWAKRDTNLIVFFNHQFEEILKNKNQIIGAYFGNGETGLRVKAKIIIDGTELGDVFAKAGAAYDLGMDDPKVSGEKEARVKNNIIQDLTWAAILKDFGEGADKTITRPVNYDSTKYFCSTADAPCNDKPYQFNTKKVLDYGKLPRSPGARHDKYMLNWPANGNDYYLNAVEMRPELRVQSYELAKQQTLGFIYFLQTTLGMKNIGLADDELNGGMALIPYNREGRRVKGMVRLNINHLKDPYNYTLYRTGIAVGDYPVDHHHAQYPGKVPEIGFPKIPSFNIPLGCLIPEKIDGLIVCEKGISVTNIVNGSTRLQPVVLLTGQAAGVLAAKSILLNKKPREISVRSVQEELLKLKCYLMPFVDVKPEDPHWEAIQRVGVSGILKGFGKSEGWANKMFFYPDSLVRHKDITNGFNHFNQTTKQLSNSDGYPTIYQAILTIRGYSMLYPGIKVNSPPDDKLMDQWYLDLQLNNFDSQRPITRYEFAVLLDHMLNLFNKNISINGTLRK